MNYVKNKVFAFDLDGTLVNSNKELLDSTKIALNKLRENGAIIVLATGRILEGVLHLAEELEFEKLGGYILSYNGGLIYSPSKHESIYDNRLNFEQASLVHDYIKGKNCLDISYTKTNILYDGDFNDYLLVEEKCTKMKALHVNDLKENFKNGVNKLLVVDEPSKIDPIIEDINNKFDYIDAYKSAPYFLEIVPTGVNKGASLIKLLDILNLTKEDLIVFGDSYNDIEMIQLAGIGIVMDNGCDEAKHHASYVTKSNDEDGIAFAVENIMNGTWK